MDGLATLGSSLVIGLIFGFLFSIPVGPINLAIINEGAKRGFKWGVLIGFGAIAMDILYCGAAFAGFSGMFGTPVWQATIELLSFLALIYLGVKYLQATELPATTK